MARGHGQIRRTQVITTYGPGALIDLPRDSAIVAGLETWPNPSQLEEIIEPRLVHKLQSLTGVSTPRLFAPPPPGTELGKSPLGIGAFRFPEWFVVQDEAGGADRERSRRLVNRRALDEKKHFDGRRVVATRFVRACPRGHVDDLDWYGFIHGRDNNCRRQLWLDERGTGGDLGDLTARCECEKSRPLSDASKIELNPLGFCRGSRPWLGKHSDEDCTHPSRLLIRTASNAYFPQVLSALSLPNSGDALATVVAELWDDLQIVENSAHLKLLKKKPTVTQKLSPYSDADVLKAIEKHRHGGVEERPVKQVELDALLDVPEGFGDDVPIDPDFHARRLPEKVWRRSELSLGVGSVTQAHRLREVMTLVGFTRLEAVTPDIDGEYETDVERADLALDPEWFPAVENRGEGVFIELRATALAGWLKRPQVSGRVDALSEGYDRWAEDRKLTKPFPGGPYVLLHTLSHLLLQSLAMQCGYPASSIRERIYVDYAGSRFGLLLYTGSSDAEGTLGGLVQQGRHFEDHLTYALRMSSLCSNDPICAQHVPGKDMEGRWLHGAACHGCALVAETSCEMRNDFLDRALVVPTLGTPRETAFFDFK